MGLETNEELCRVSIVGLVTNEELCRVSIVGLVTNEESCKVVWGIIKNFMHKYSFVVSELLR